jgi:hypothetical protein
MLNLLIEFLLGSAVNFLTWSVLNHIFVPDIRFSHTLMALPGNSRGLWK